MSYKLLKILFHTMNFIMIGWISAMSIFPKYDIKIFSLQVMIVTGILFIIWVVLTFKFTVKYYEDKKNSKKKEKPYNLGPVSV